MRNRYFLYLVLTAIVVSGCAGFTQNGSFSNDVFLSKQSATPPSTATDEEVNDSNQQITAATDTDAAEDSAPSVAFDSGETTAENDFDNVKKPQPVLDEALELCQVSQEYWQNGDLENALEALDQAYALILGVDTSDEPKLIQQKEDLRFMISKRILEIYASRNIVVNGSHNAIPIVINRHVQNEINLFTTGREKNFFIDSYKRSGKYRPHIVAALREAGLPEELSWLPLIESGYKVKALSRSRALGLWQFIPSTGYKFGLNRDKFVDERMDPAKSTQAAIGYLKELHGLFGDWATVLAAYNCGEGRVLRVIRSQNINYLDNFWDLYERLPRETARYVPRFLATLHIVNHPEKYGLNYITVNSPLESETVTVSKKVHLKNIAKTTGIDDKTLQELNPELRYQILPGENYALRLPIGSGPIVLAKINQIPVSNPPQRAYVYHRVRSGETLSTIARRYRTSVGSIMRANNMSRSNYIVAGKKLKIPQKGYVASKPKVVRVKLDSGQGMKHVVRKGDSLWIIARQYGTTTNKIKKLNLLSSNNLHIGQQLTIFPGKPKEAPKVDGLGTYEVRPGDSPFLIAKQHNMKLNRLLQLNQLYPGAKIFPGQHLYID